MGDTIFIVMLVGVLVVLGGAGLYAKKVIDKTDPGVQNEINDKDTKNAQGFLPFSDIRDFVIDLGGDKFRAVLECSSVNYNLKTDVEREVIEISYQNFISSLSHPITFHIQTKKIDNTLIVRELEKDIEVLQNKNPKLLEYGQVYLESIRGLGTYLGDSKQKKKYIIIPYDEAGEVAGLTYEEKFEYAKHQLQDRAWYIMEQLSAMGIKSELLSEQGLVDMVYSAYQRDGSVFDVAEGIAKGEFFAPVVMGKNKRSSMSGDELIDYEILQLQNKIRDEFLGMGVDKEMRTKAADIYEALNIIREEVGKPYQSSYDSIYGVDYGVDRDNVERVDDINKASKKNKPSNMHKVNDVYKTDAMVYKKEDVKTDDIFMDLDIAKDDVFMDLGKSDDIFVDLGKSDDIFVDLASDDIVNINSNKEYSKDSRMSEVLMFD